MKWYILILLAVVIGYAALKLGEEVAKPDPLTEFFNCTDDMKAGGMDALQVMSFCSGVLNAQ